HVNIDRKEFAEGKIIEYLEEQSATSRGYKLPDVAAVGSTAPAAMRFKPGPVAMPEFWHQWAAKLAPQAVQKVGTGQIATLAETDDKPRAAGMRYVELLRPALVATLNETQQELLTDRYRRALIREVNVARRREGLSRLDESRAQLAHPRLDLYVDQDSKHAYE